MGENICLECGWHYLLTDYCAEGQLEAEELETRRDYPQIIECIYYILSSNELIVESLAILNNIKNSKDKQETHKYFRLLQSTLIDFYRTSQLDPRANFVRANEYFNGLLDSIETQIFKENL